MPRKSVVRLTDRPDMTLDVYRGRQTTTMFYCPFQGGTSVVVPQCYMLICLCVYSLQRYDHLYNCCPLYSLFSSVLQFKIENR